MSDSRAKPNVGGEEGAESSTREGSTDGLKVAWRLLSAAARGIAAAVSVVLVYLSVAAFVEMDAGTIAWVAPVVFLAAIALGILAGLGRPPLVRRLAWPFFVLAVVSHLWAMYVVFFAPNL